MFVQLFQLFDSVNKYKEKRKVYIKHAVTSQSSVIMCNVHERCDICYNNNNKFNL